LNNASGEDCCAVAQGASINNNKLQIIFFISILS